MNWSFASSLDQVWRSSAFPMWLTLAAGVFFAIVLLVTVLRAEKSVANGALAVITLLAIGVAVAATLRGFGGEGRPEISPAATVDTAAALPALACVDDMAGETVLNACEKVLFGTPDRIAAAVGYAASRIDRVLAGGAATETTRARSPDFEALRRSIERDRFGFYAYVLTTRDRCSAELCAAYTALTDHNQVAANMLERVFERNVTRYTHDWDAPVSPPAVASLPGAFAGGNVPTGRPTNADFPTSASIPPVNIMTSEPAPSSQAPPASPQRTAPWTANATGAQAPAPAATTNIAVKKPPKPRPAPALKPVQLAPTEPNGEN